MLTRVILAVVALGLLSALAAGGGPGDRPLPAGIDYYFTGGTTPLLVRLRVEIDGEPFPACHENARQHFLRGLFRFLDRDGDGTLSKAEARNAPVPLVSLDGAGIEDVHVAFSFSALDRDGDGRVTPGELADYYADFEYDALSDLVETPTPARARPAGLLFAKLDTDGDGKLSLLEIAASAKLLARLDLDEDDLITPEEVQGRPVNPGLVGLGGVVPQPTSGIPPAFVRAGRGHSLDKQLQGRKPDVELLLRLGSRPANRPALELLSAKKRTMQVGPDEMTLLADGVRVQFRCDRSTMSPDATASMKRQFLREFQTADADGDGKVDREEARRSLFLRDQFDALDHDADGRLTGKEVGEYVRRVLHARAVEMSRRLALHVSEEGTDLWDLLDRDRNGILGLREVRDAPAVLATLAGKDGSFGRKDIPKSYVIQVGPGRTTPDRVSGDDVVVLSDRGTLTFPPAGMGGGPLWFRKTDLNGDGVLSAREFLGTPEQFKKLDLDGDGLVSREEAVGAEKRRGK
jgi:Ca2+-binding EF-hand superfamily protein